MKLQQLTFKIERDKTRETKKIVLKETNMLYLFLKLDSSLILEVD